MFTSPADATLTIVDDGRGRPRELARYHEIASSTKSRGEGIGFAGVGIKPGLLVSREVIRDRGSAIGDGPTPTEIAAGTLQTTSGRRRPARYGLLVQFESRPEDSELARLVDSTVWINDAHPALVRASASRSLGYHTVLSVALALAPLAVEAEHEHGFITHFLAH